ncbi:HNH endonuclease [Pseudoalteromonas sp. T1lg24]|uniref:HNH endonuclease n=1 Tax=Pseudoalteromonas sp. T1lg24 TaxID=2077099 RepID=UPI000CF606AA|nr:HNH endonuclease [Pseudoalteromonas sp. T1lg24]
MFTVKEFLEFAHSVQNRKWKTLKQNKGFTYFVDLEKQKIVLTLESNPNKPKPVSKSELEKFCNIFNDKQSFKTTDYPNSFTKVYFLAIADLYCKRQGFKASTPEKLELINSFEEAFENAQIFSKVGEFKDSQAFKTLGQFYHWYYFPEIDVFAPRKFIRYKRQTVQEYDGRGLGGDSSASNLASFFRIVDEDSKEFKLLKTKLDAFLNGLGKTASVKKGGIYVPFDCDTNDINEVDSNTVYKEGTVKQILVNAYERNVNARKACLQEHGYNCSVCSFDFEKMYGDLGKEFIHVHHEVDISTIGDEYEVDPVKDLKPVCPNCHAMLHKTRPAMKIEKLKKLINKSS